MGRGINGESNRPITQHGRARFNRAGDQLPDTGQKQHCQIAQAASTATKRADQLAPRNLQTGRA